MAASYSVSLTCRICGTVNTVTNAKEASGGENDALRMNRVKKCARCGNPFLFKFSSIAVAHSGNVGSNTTITHTVTNGSISSAVS